MRDGLPAMALFGGITAFAACGASLALLGLGFPYVICAAISGCCAGLLIYAMGRWALPRPAPIKEPPIMETPAERPEMVRLAALEREMSALRHELRGALSPALMVSDRLLKNDDPLIRRAGDAVVRSVERATALIGQERATAPSTARPTPPAA